MLLAEVGYPTAEACASSEAQQAAFVDAVLAAWDRHAARIPFVAFLWLTDLSPADADALTRLYFGDTPFPTRARFREYLRTLGLRRHDGADKPALGTLRRALAARGWPLSP